MIGGTDISAILGMNPWRSAHDVYLKQIGEAPEIEQTDRMAWGLILETPISAEYQRRHQEYLVLPHEKIKHQHLNYIGGSPDRVCKVGLDIVRGLEIKTAGWKDDQWGDDGTDEIPPHYLMQCVWYGGLFNGLDCDVAALFGGSEYHEYSIKFDSELWNMMVEAAVKFHADHVQKRIPPEATSTDMTRNWIKRKYAKNTLPLKHATSNEEVLISEYRHMKTLAEDHAKEVENLKIKLQLAIGDCDGLEFPQGKITWKKNKDSLKVDWESLAKELKPSEQQIVNYTKTKEGARVFKLTTKKGEE